MLPLKKTLTPAQAYDVQVKYNEDHNLDPPSVREVYRNAKYYEGTLSYRTIDRNWVLYEDVWLYYLENGFPDRATKGPSMKLSVALRYLHSCGIDPNYKLREFRRDVDALGMIIKHKEGSTIHFRITRSNCNKFIGIWNGNR